MTEMYFMPTRFARAVKKLAEKHPVRRSELDLADIINNSDLGRILRNKLRITPIPSLGQLLQTLTPFEKELLSPLALDTDQEIRHKVIRCLCIAPKNANPHHLWQSFMHFYDEISTDQLAMLMNSDSDLQMHWKPVQKEIIYGRESNPAVGLRLFWASTLQHRLTMNNALTVIDALRTSRFSVLAANFLLTYGDRSLWDLQGLQTIMQCYAAATQSIQLKTFVQGHKNYASLSMNEIYDNPVIMRLAEELRSDKSMFVALETFDEPAWSWYKKLRAWREIEAFFNATNDTDNERFVFWRDFRTHIQDADFNQQHSVLCMDFGNFGVIEFGDIGNAAYIYNPTDYKYFSTFQLPRDMKDQDRALGRIIHRANWQYSTGDTIRDLLQLV